MIRCFVGLPLPQYYQLGLEKLALTLKKGLCSKVSWVRPGNFHLTLKFLGNVAEPDLERVRDALSCVRFKPFSLQAGRGGFFPNSYKPRNIWAGLVQGADECRQLAADVDAELAHLSFAPHKRDFRAHLTIGRIRKPRRDDWTKLLKVIWDRKWPEIKVSEIVLFKSDLLPSGPKYTRLGEFLAK